MKRPVLLLILIAVPSILHLILDILFGHNIQLLFAPTAAATKHSQHEYNSTVTKQRLAVARTFCDDDARNLLKSFDIWDELVPCHETPKFPVDLIISFSQSFDRSAVARQAVEAVKQKFHETQGWNGCFEKLIAFGTNIDSHLDQYEPMEQNHNYNWVNGPNRQFERTIRYISKFGRSINEDYEMMYLMEGDSVPMKSYWLDAILSEIEDTRPFAILGSSYKGDKWNSFFNKLPSSLIHHTNGNAVYNITHPFFLNLVGELESEAKTSANSVAFDHRMQQIIQEGLIGKPNKLKHFRHAEIMPTKTGLFQRWVQEYPPEDVVKESMVNGNYASTNMIRDLVGENIFIVHGAKMHKTWDNTLHGEVTLVVSDWDEGNAHQLLSSLGESEHPFSKVLVMRPDHGNTLARTRASIPVHLHSRGNNPDSMDFCAAPVTTEWFVMTNSYYRLKSIVTLMVDAKKNGRFRPLVSTVDADETTCFPYQSCVQDLKVAKHFLPKMTKIFQSDNIIFKTSIRDQFCEKLKSLQIASDLKATPATAYMAYIAAEIEDIKNLYRLSDRRKDGSRFYFVPLPADLLPPSMAMQQRRNRQLQVVASNETECTGAASAAECNTLIGCNWQEDFGSCRDTPLLDDLAADAITLDNSTDLNSTDLISKGALDNATGSLQSVLSQANSSSALNATVLEEWFSGNSSGFLGFLGGNSSGFNVVDGNLSALPGFGSFNTSAMPGMAADLSSGDFASLFGNASNFASLFGNVSNFASLLGYKPPSKKVPNSPAQQQETLSEASQSQGTESAQGGEAMQEQEPVDTEFSDGQNTQAQSTQGQTAQVQNTSVQDTQTQGQGQSSTQDVVTVAPLEICRVEVVMEGQPIRVVDIACPG